MVKRQAKEEVSDKKASALIMYNRERGSYE